MTMPSSVVLDALSSPFELHGGVSPDLVHEHGSDYLLSTEHHNMKEAVATSSGVSSATTADPYNVTDVHLGMIWKILSDRRNNSTTMYHEYMNNQAKSLTRPVSSLELVVFQATLLSLILAAALLWAFCCKNKCIGDAPLASEIVARHVAALARKISSSSARDLPPSYSKVDLTVIGLSINDHFNPPPSYDRAIEAAANSTNAEYIASTMNPGEMNRGRRVSRLSVVSTTSSNVTIVGGARGEGGGVWAAPQRFHPQPSSQSLPLPPCLVAAGRRRSVLSQDGSRSRRVSFIDEVIGVSSPEQQNEALEVALRARMNDADGNTPISEQQALPCSTIVELGSSEDESES